MDDQTKAPVWGMTLQADGRDDAIATGVLYDVTHDARHFGLGTDVAISAAVHHMLSQNFSGVAKQVALGAVLANAAMWLHRGGDLATFSMPIGYEQAVEGLQAVLGPNDAGNTCVTIGILQDWQPSS